MNLKINPIQIIGIIISVCLIVLIIYTFVFVNKVKKEKIKQKQTQEIITKQKQPAFSISDMQNQLGPDWKPIRLSEKRWYGPFKARSGSGWEIYQGEVWIKIGNKKAFLDKPRTETISVGGGNYMFYPKTLPAIVFYRY